MNGYRLLAHILMGSLAVAFLASCSKREPKVEELRAYMETSMGTIVIKLFEDATPKTVENFVGLAQGTKPWKAKGEAEEKLETFFDGLTFHRVIDDFMIQGGCPLGNGTGGPGYQFADECYEGELVPLEGAIENPEMGMLVFSKVLRPHLQSHNWESPIEEVTNLFMEMNRTRSAEPLVGKTVEEIQSLVGSTEKLTRFQPTMHPLTGEIKDDQTASIAFQQLIRRHISENETPAEEVDELFKQIQAAQSLDSLKGKTIEEIKSITGIDEDLEQPKLLGKVEYGTLCMANSGPDTNGSQFFIVTKKDGCPWLNGKHTVFGEVIEGMEVAEAIQKVDKDASDKPTEPVTIVKIEIKREII